MPPDEPRATSTSPYRHWPAGACSAGPARSYPQAVPAAETLHIWQHLRLLFLRKASRCPLLQPPPAEETARCCRRFCLLSIVRRCHSKRWSLRKWERTRMLLAGLQQGRKFAEILALPLPLQNKRRQMPAGKEDDKVGEEGIQNLREMWSWEWGKRKSVSEHEQVCVQTRTLRHMGEASLLLGICTGNCHLWLSAQLQNCIHHRCKTFSFPNTLWCSQTRHVCLATGTVWGTSKTLKLKQAWCPSP